MEDQEHITPIDQHIIDFVIRLRMERDLSQERIADLLGVKRSFIGNIESTNNRAKYNFRHINILADYFDISPRDFLPANPLEHNFQDRENKLKLPTKKSDKKTKVNKSLSAESKEKAKELKNKKSKKKKSK